MEVACSQSIFCCRELLLLRQDDCKFSSSSFAHMPSCRINKCFPLRTGMVDRTQSSYVVLLNFLVSLSVSRARKSKQETTAKGVDVKKKNTYEEKDASSSSSLLREQNSLLNESILASESEVFDDSKDFEFEQGYTMARVCDRLIEVFTVEKKSEEEWRKLLLMSEDWSKIRLYFYKRCKFRANLETEPQKKEDLMTLSEKIKMVDEDIERHNRLLSYVKENWPELDAVVAGRRKDFSNAFFNHIKLYSEFSINRVDKRDDLARFAAKCLAAVEAHDRALEDDVAVAIAQKRFEDILDSPSLEEACEKIDEIARKKQLDSTLMLFLAKAWAAAKESSTMNQELKDLMHHLYLVARGHLQQMIPKEIKILQHILSFEDPNQRFAALTESFCPGEESIEKDRNVLHTKPEKLHKWIKLVLDGYYLNKQTTLMESARQLMNPIIIERLLQLKDVVEDQFM